MYSSSKAGAMTTAGGMQCICSDQGMAASCTLPPDAAGSWTPLLLLAALLYVLWHRDDESSDDEGQPPSEMYN